jgi:DNA mismatch repair ATPase MutS
MSAPGSYYEEQITSYTTRLGIVRARLFLLAMLRLIAFIAFCAAVYACIPAFPLGLTSVAVILLAAFIVLVKFYFRLGDQKTLLEKLVFVNTNEQGVLSNKPNGFADGKDQLDSDSYLDDLDIFGPRSLFHLVNRTTTSHGKARLSELLRKPNLSIPHIIRQQQAIQVMTAQPDKRQLLTAKGLLADEKEGNLFSLFDWLATPSRIYRHRVMTLVRWSLVLYNLFCIGLYLATDTYFPLLLGVALSWSITASFKTYIFHQHLLISKKQAILDQYSSILEVFNKMDTKGSTLLQEEQARTARAYQAIRRLSQLAGFFDQRLNMLVNILLNSFALYDLQCISALEKWKETYKKEFPEWIETVGNIETLNSLATFAFSNPSFCYPVPMESGQLQITATGMAHPLIRSIERVTNDCTIGKDQRLILVTGSNMSGKTTFLRTTGVNLLLAMNGAPVCATSFSFTPMQLLTSLRISDSLQEHTSYFMAELKKLQRIIHRLQENVPSLVLIDEILRGTNSDDKTYGSEQFIRKLLQYPCLSFFATHDLSLGSLEEELPGLVSNYCFESTIDGNELHFDYRLRQGIARNRNASFLMKKMDII